MKNRKNRPKKNQGPSYEAEHNYDEEEEIRLNKYIAHCGYCSRRDADDYIAAGKVEVNDEIVTQMGVKVQRSDKVSGKGAEAKPGKF
ncbi:MAG: S4 domain-containing protein [Fodinibius sp.]|nr:S4 domain-containing protein [Fodinibius sp.]